MSRRRKKRRKGFALALIESLLGIALFVVILGFACYFFCPLKNVEVEGTDLYSADQIQEYILDDEYSFNTVYVFLKNLIWPKHDAEFIDSFDVKMTGPNSIKIVCNEKTILGYMQQEDGNYVYFDYEGLITEISETFVDRGYMKVAGVTCEDPSIGQILPIGDNQVGYLTSLIKILQKNDLMPSAITYDDEGHITISYVTYNVSLGSSVYLEEKIDRMIRILPQIEGLYGTLHLENYSSQNTDIVFEKNTDVEE